MNEEEVEQCHILFLKWPPTPAKPTLSFSCPRCSTIQQSSVSWPELAHPGLLLRWNCPPRRLRGPFERQPHGQQCGIPRPRRGASLSRYDSRFLQQSADHLMLCSYRSNSREKMDEWTHVLVVNLEKYFKTELNFLLTVSVTLEKCT